MAAPSLTRQQRVECEEQCDRLLCETLAGLARYNGIMDTRKWRELKSRGQLTVYGRIHARDTAVARVRLTGTGYIQGSLEEVERGLYCDTDRDLMGIEAVLSGQCVRGGAVLQVLEARGPETPFRFGGIKWRAIQGTNSITDRPYDLITFERMGVTLDSDNTEVAYHVVYSVPDHADWQPNQSDGEASSSTGTRLEPFALCYLYRKVSEDQVLCFIQAEFWGVSRRGVAQDILMSRILMASNVIQCCDAKVLTRMVDHCRDVSVVVSNTCQRCNKTRPSTGEALHLCGICRKSVCRACGQEKMLCRISKSTSRAELKMICVKCLKRVKRSASTTKSSSQPAGKPREGWHRSHSVQEEESKPAMRRMSLPEPAPSYNYDELLRKRASSSRSWTSSTSSGEANETDVVPLPSPVSQDHPRDRSHSNEDLYLPGRYQQSDTAELQFHRHLERQKDPSPVAVEVVRDRRRSNEDLYLPERNQMSDVAERQFHRHLERHRKLDLQSFHDQRPRQSPLKTEPSTTDTPVAVRFERHTGGVAAAVNHPNVDARVKKPSNTAEKKKAQREFYRDLYTEL